MSCNLRSVPTCCLGKPEADGALTLGARLDAGADGTDVLRVFAVLH